MIDRALRKLSRKQLLELLITSKRENDRLKEQLQQQAEQLQGRDIRIKDAGSLAEAALTLNDVFECADRAAAQYLENAKRLSDEQQSAYDRIIAEAEQKAKMILESAEAERLQKMNAADKAEDKAKMILESAEAERLQKMNAADKAEDKVVGVAHDGSECTLVCE